MITFKKIIKEDIPTLCDIRNMCVDYLHNSNKFNIEESIIWFDKTKPNFYSILLDGNMIGYFRTSNYSEENRNIYIGADLHPNFWGKGIGFESYSKFLPYMFQTFNLNKISLEVLSTNERAINLYNKLGFKTEGIKREEVFKKGTFVDSILMSILKKDFKYDFK
jgi:RimJ/RimL family protein N-acetyltransferase